MSQLAKIQHAFFDYLKGHPSDIENMVVGKNAQEIQRRLSVYRDAYVLRLEENLRKQFPVLASYLPPEIFNNLACGYIAVFPPKGFAIRSFGADFTQFLKEACPQEPYLSELAMFEWAMNISLDESADAKLLTAEDLQKIAPEALMTTRFTFHPSVQLLIFNYDIPNWWHALKKNPKSAKSPATAHSPLHCLIWRKAVQPYFRTVSDKEQVIFQAAKNQADFSQLCEAILPFSNENEAAQQVAMVLMQWLTDGCLTNVN